MASPIHTQLAAPGADARTATPRRSGSDAQHLAWQREMERAESEAWFKTSIEDRAAAAFNAPTLTPSLPEAPVLPARASQAEVPRSATATTVSTEGRSDAGAASQTGRQIDREVQHASSADIAARDAAPASQLADAESPAKAALRATSAAAVDSSRATVAARGAVLESIAQSGFLPGLRDPMPRAASLAATLSQGTEPNASAAAAAPMQPPAPASPVAPASFRVASERLTGAIARALEATPPVRLHVEWNAGGATVWIGLDSAAARELPQLVDSLSRWLSRIGLRLRSVVCNGATCYERHDAADPASSPTDIDVIVDKET